MFLNGCHFSEQLIAAAQEGAKVLKVYTHILSGRIFSAHKSPYTNMSLFFFSRFAQQKVAFRYNKGNPL